MDSETQSCETVMELKSRRDTSEGSEDPHLSSEDSGDAAQKKAKPPPVDVSPIDNIQGPKTLDRRKERKIGHRRVDDEGQITFKKIGTSQIQGSIQLGIGHAVGSLASKPERDLLMLDFTIVETTQFSRDGSNLTPAHHFSDFKFKAYAPLAFRYFRDLFGIQPDDYLLSLCNYPMQELTNPGASGSIFYLTDDGEFIIKTVQHKEAEFLQKLLPGYYMNLNENPRTLLPKYFGLYCYICGGKNIRLVVMNNLLPSCAKMHEKYDLKGSTYKRRASKYEKKKASPVYKDLDFMERHPDGIYLEPETYNALTKTISRDCRVLESFKIMDYSLLVGIHNLDLAKRGKMEEEGNGRLSDESESASSPVQKNELVRSKSMNRQRLAAFSTAMESIQAEIEPVADEDVPPGGIPAKNAKGERLLLFLGIIDILQSFRLKKKLEHAWKSVLHDGDTVSVHRPGFYAQRFQEFMGKTVFKKAPALKHSPSKRKGISGRPRQSDAVPLKVPSGSDCTQTESSILAQSSGTSNLSETESSTTEAYDSRGSNSSKGRIVGKSRSNTDPPHTIPLRSVLKTTSVSWERNDVSLSQVTIQMSDCVSETSSSSTSGIGSSTLHTMTWTPPHSAEGSTPTHTEGTPSFTESSSSGDAACPTTPVLPPLGETQILQGAEMTRL